MFSCIVICSKGNFLKSIFVKHHNGSRFLSFQFSQKITPDPLEKADSLEYFGQRPWRQGCQGTQFIFRYPF